MSVGTTKSADQAQPAASRYLAPWTVDELVPTPSRQGRRILSILGPGILLAGSSIGAGEWLFGPAVTAQYGGTLLWLATLSIVLQVFVNLEVMRYTLYCGEPVFIGFFRTWPGPIFWTVCYVILFGAHIWPFMASNAAVPLAAALLGHLPGEGSVAPWGFEISEANLVKVLGFAIFYGSFVPLVFGGKVYTMIERLMAFKLFVVLGFLITVTAWMASSANVKEVVTGFVRFGDVPLRAETVVAGRHFSLSEHEGSTRYTLQGTVEAGTPQVTALVVDTNGVRKRYESAAGLSTELTEVRARLAARATTLARPGEFYVVAASGSDTKDAEQLTVRGTIGERGTWELSEASLHSPFAQTTWHTVDEIPEPYRDRVAALVANQGFEREPVWTYWREHGRLPDLDWGMLAAFAAIAGAGGLSNSLLSNFARDKGWGMGYQTGAIPSAIGGRTISLSHVGKIFPLNPDTLERWRRWYRFIVRDQAGMWMICSFIGMALPCMLSLEFIRNAPVGGNRVAALTAEGIAGRFPDYRQFWWVLTLGISFLVLAPNAVFSGDLIARVWTDLLWVVNRRTHKLAGHQVRYVYYAILALYSVWGSLALWWFDPLQIAKLSGILNNIALGFTALHTLGVNRTLLPRELRPNRFMQAGLVAAGLFFLTITVVVFWYS